MRLYREFQLDQADKGSYFLPNTHNLNMSKNMFEKYAEGQLEGFTFFWEDPEPVGFLLCGSDINESGWDLTLGKLCIMWAVYVQPSHRGQGITGKLFKRANELGIAMGYETVMTYVLSTNPLGQRAADLYGVRPALVEYNLPLLEGLKEVA